MLGSAWATYREWLLLGLPLLWAACGWFAGGRPAPVTAAADRPALAFEQYLVDYGEISATDEVKVHFGFRNNGKAAVQVTGLVPSCGCMQPKLDQREYQPGESGRFLLRVQTANQGEGAKEYHVTVKYHDPLPREVDLLFRLVLPDSRVFVKPRALAFYVLGSKPVTQEVEIIDRRPEHLAIDLVECAPDLADIEILEETLDESGAWRGRVRVTVPGNAPDGRHQALLKVHTTDATYPTLRVPLVVYGGRAASSAAQRDAPGRR
jgi:hypothetical protein